MDEEKIKQWLEAYQSTVPLTEDISKERLQRYLRWSHDDTNKAFDLYRINTLLSERFYTALHMLEIVLRNKINALLTREYGMLWYRNKALIISPTQGGAIQKKLKNLEKRRSGKFSHGHLIAELNFGFWCSFFGHEYENLWQMHLHKITIPMSGERGLVRKHFSEKLGNIRNVRNRIAHYEPILHLDLEEIHA